MSQAPFAAATRSVGTFAEFCSDERLGPRKL